MTQIAQGGTGIDRLGRIAMLVTCGVLVLAALYLGTIYLLTRQ